MNGWDLCLARRSAAIGGVAALVTLLVVAATDAGGPWSLRLGTTAALAPLAGALGTLAAMRLAEARGELRALAALGADPGRAVLGAAIGGVAIGAIGALVAASPLADLGALFPRVPARIWVADGAGMRELSLGLRVGPGGALALEAARGVTAALPPRTSVFALLAIAAAALACPAWLAFPGVAAARRVGIGALALGAAVVAFQGVAAGRSPALALVVAPLVLLTDAALARYLGRGHDLDRLAAR